MSHRDRSIANMRCEAKRIYNQRRYINKLEKDKKELQQRIYKAIEYIENDKKLKEGFNLFEEGANKLLEILNGGNNE